MKKNSEKNPDVNFAPKSPEQLDKECQESIKNFNELLDTLSSLDDKRKALWRQIYENAITDRRNGYIMFSDLYQKVHGHGDQHALHGVTLAKYLERLNKSNEQLIKLADLVDSAVVGEEDNTINQEDIYKHLGNINKKREIS